MELIETQVTLRHLVPAKGKAIRNKDNKQNWTTAGLYLSVIDSEDNYEEVDIVTAQEDAEKELEPVEVEEVPIDETTMESEE